MLKKQFHGLLELPASKLMENQNEEHQAVKILKPLPEKSNIENVASVSLSNQHLNASFNFELIKIPPFG